MATSSNLQNLLPVLPSPYGEVFVSLAQATHDTRGLLGLHFYPNEDILLITYGNPLSPKTFEFDAQVLRDFLRPYLLQSPREYMEKVVSEDKEVGYVFALGPGSRLVLLTVMYPDTEKLEMVVRFDINLALYAMSKGGKA